MFLYDHKRDELWTKSAKNSVTIRINPNQGLVGYVVKSKAILNVLDAHNDERFNREVDKKNNYRTKSVLCCPIFDPSTKNIMGNFFFF